MNCTFSLLNKNQIHNIQELWEKLNETHLIDSIHFKDHYKSFTFNQRCDKFNHIPEDNIRIEILQDKDIYVGYCISTIDNITGEIDSLFIEPNYRKYGFGSELVKNSMNWFKINKCRKIIVAVAAGHESVFAFYQKFNFYPRTTYLELKE
jgi:ribosomal protein S18 acetylase RimI-like enzyme